MAWAVEKQDTSSLWRDGEEAKAREAFLDLCAANYDRRHLAPYDLFPNSEDAAKAWRCHDWLQDPVFMAEVTARLDEDEEARWLNDLREIAANAPQMKDRLKALELIGENKKFISKGPTINNNNNVDNRSVKYLAVPPPINDANRAEAEAEFRRHQEGLIIDARSRRPS